MRVVIDKPNRLFVSVFQCRPDIRGSVVHVDSVLVKGVGDPSFADTSTDVSLCIGVSMGVYGAR